MHKMVSEVPRSENETSELSPKEELGPAMHSPSKESLTGEENGFEKWGWGGGL